jgi:hypothetical protein
VRLVLCEELAAMVESFGFFVFAQSSQGTRQLVHRPIQAGTGCTELFLIYCEGSLQSALSIGKFAHIAIKNA